MVMKAVSKFLATKFSELLDWYFPYMTVHELVILHIIQRS